MLAFCDKTCDVNELNMLGICFEYSLYRYVL